MLWSSCATTRFALLPGHDEVAVRCLRRVDQHQLRILQRGDLQTFASSRIAAPSRALTRTPLTSTSCRPPAPGRGGASFARARIPRSRRPSAWWRAPARRRGSAARHSSPATPLAMVTNLPERSDFGNGLAPQVGWPPLVLGSIQIWKILRLGRLQIVFGVTHAAAGAHHLHVARFGAALVAEAVLMGDRAFANIGDDFHVGVGMGGKAGVRRDLVVVPHPQASRGRDWPGS